MVYVLFIFYLLIWLLDFFISWHYPIQADIISENISAFQIKVRGQLSVLIYLLFQLSKAIFDAGLSFSLLQVEYEDGEWSEGDPRLVPDMFIIDAHS